MSPKGKVAPKQRFEEVEGCEGLGLLGGVATGVPKPPFG